MLVNWQFSDLSAAGTVKDSVHGNNLTVEHVEQVGFTPDTPALTFSLDENSLTGTDVGRVEASDIEREATIATLLSADPNLRYNADTEKFYQLIDTADNWVNSQTTATSTLLNGSSGQLVTIHSATENEYVTSLANEIGGSVWLGLSDVEVEGEWRLSEGSTEAQQIWQGTGSGYAVDGAYQNWESPNEPNDDSNNEDVAYLQSSGAWNDLDASETWVKLIVEWDADAVLDTSDALNYSIETQTVAGAFAIDASTGKITVAH